MVSSSSGDSKPPSSSKPSSSSKSSGRTPVFETESGEQRIGEHRRRAPFPSDSPSTRPPSFSSYPPSSAPPSSSSRGRRKARSSLPPRFEPWNNPEMLAHVDLYLTSYSRLLGKELILPGPLVARARALWEAPFVAVSHGPEFDARFSYANRTALTLWEMEWGEFIGMPSRYSAQSTEREERDRLLRAVARDGFTTGYNGVRASKNGRRFRIQDVTVWNLIDDRGQLRGQAATYNRWTFL